MILINLFCNFLEIIFRHGCSLVNSLHIFRTTFPKNTCLLLMIVVLQNKRKKDKTLAYLFCGILRVTKHHVVATRKSIFLRHRPWRSPAFVRLVDVAKAYFSEQVILASEAATRGVL